MRDLEPLHLEGARERFGRRISDEELLLRLTMPEEQVNAMLTSRSAPAASPGSPPVQREASGDDRHPVVTLLREVSKRKSITHLRVQKGDDLVVWRRAT